MNYWIAEITGLGGVTDSLWDYMKVHTPYFSPSLPNLNSYPENMGTQRISDCRNPV